MFQSTSPSDQLWILSSKQINQQRHWQSAHSKSKQFSVFVVKSQYKIVIFIMISYKVNEEQSDKFLSTASDLGKNKKPVDVG
jgi:hypothetical protein